MQVQHSDTLVNRLLNFTHSTCSTHVSRAFRYGTTKKNDPVGNRTHAIAVCISLMADGPQRARIPIPPTATLSSCLLWSLRFFPSLPSSRLTNFYRDASSALLQIVNQWVGVTYPRSHAFRYGRQTTNSALTRIELTTSALAGVRGYLLLIDHSGNEHWHSCETARF